MQQENHLRFFIQISLQIHLTITILIYLQEANVVLIEQLKSDGTRKCALKKFNNKQQLMTTHKIPIIKSSALSFREPQTPELAFLGNVEERFGRRKQPLRRGFPSKNQPRTLSGFVALNTDAGVHPEIFGFLREDRRREQQRVEIHQLLIQAQADRSNDLSPSKVLTAKDAAFRLNISIRTIHHWARAGWLHRWKVGRRTFFCTAEVEAVLLAIDARSYCLSGSDFAQCSQEFS